MLVGVAAMIVGLTLVVVSWAFVIVAFDCGILIRRGLGRFRGGVVFEGVGRTQCFRLPGASSRPDEPGSGLQLPACFPRPRLDCGMVFADCRLLPPLQGLRP